MTRSSGEVAAAIDQIAAACAALPEVRAVALAGSRAGGTDDARSDIDLYLYAGAPVPIEARPAIILPRAAIEPAPEIGSRIWEEEGDWVEPNGLSIEVIHRTPDWIEGELDRVLVRHEARLGYSTWFWHSVRMSQILHDDHEWYAKLKEKAEQPYPEPLAEAIIGSNRPVLRDVLSSYAHQIELAAARDDHIAINHRLAAFLASYFDILFAVNRTTHPGEKRLLAHAAALPSIPADMEADISEVLGRTGDAPSRLMPCIEAFCDVLDVLVARDGPEARGGRG